MSHDRDAVADFLGDLERREAVLLTWGLAEGAFSEDEVEDLARQFIHRRNLWATFPEPDELVERAESMGLLFAFEQGGRRCYRTRMAESVRLFLRLRQLFPKHLNNHGWATAPTLVADARFLIRPRAYPDRRVGPDEALRQLADANLLTGREEFARRLIGDRQLADFQIRAARSVLRGLGGEAAATIVCAGTGSGKTLAFYLPAMSAIAQTLGQGDWPRCLALYPRNELLKDQFSEAYQMARLLREPLTALGRRPLRIGALFGGTPRHAGAFGSAYPPDGWRRVAGGRVCPLLRCPRPGCGGELIWRDTDLAATIERLHCTACDELVRPDEVVLTRARMLREPPDILFTTTEMLNQRLSDSRFGVLFGVGTAPERKPMLMLLDEVHTYSGTSGAQAALLLRRWQHAARCRPHFVGLSATLRDARRFFATLTGVPAHRVEEQGPQPDELVRRGMEYLLALRGDPASGTSLLSTTIQASLLLRRILDGVGTPSGGLYGRKAFLFTDDLDVTNRLLFNLRDAEGQDSWGNPDPQSPGGSLANLRSPDQPDAADRFVQGQCWHLCERLGHVLRPETLVPIGRTSSQDVGVDADAEVIVATAALEVGFNDPAVGAVLQHKAPRDAAQFVQRKGRAGRDPAMRPWTLVVLSDYGRDRVAYQNYDLLFDPELPPRELPIGNRHVLRMQAVNATMEWLAGQLIGLPPGSVWQDLAVPAEQRTATERAGVRRRQEHLAGLIEGLLVRPERLAELQAYLQAALHISAEEVEVLLTEPPRPLLTAALPTALRRLRTQWRRVTPPGTPPEQEPFTHNAPLPEFIPRALFQDLNLPEVEIVTRPQQQGDSERRDSMRVAQALNEFAPGRVSRRFGLKHRYARHWISPPTLEDMPDQLLPLADYVAAGEELGRFEYAEPGHERRSVRCVRPLQMRPGTPGPVVADSASAFLDWRSQLIPWVEGVAVGVPASPLGTALAELRFFTHAQNCPIEVRRFATGSRATLAFIDGRQQLTHVHFQDDTDEYAVGFAYQADALLLRLRLPEQPHLLLADRPDVVRQVRGELFFHRLRSATGLDGVANVFARQWLAQAYLGAALRLALQQGVSLAQAVQTLAGANLVGHLAPVLDVLFQAVPIANPDEEDDATPEVRRQRTQQRLMTSLGNVDVQQALHDAAEVLCRPPGPDWDDYLLARARVTFGAAVLDAIAAVCPELDARDLLIDPDAGPRPDGAVVPVQGLHELWLTESAVGGGGVIERLQVRYGENPGHFLALVERALAPSDFELADTQLRLALTWFVSPEAGPRQAVAEVRLAQQSSHEALTTAFTRLVELLNQAGLVTTHAVLGALNARVLRPGSSSQTDQFLHDLLARWDRAEQELGVEIDPRTFAWLHSDDAGLDAALGGLIEQGGTVTPGWRYGALLSLFWPRGAAARGRLRAANPFANLVPPQREVARALLPARAAAVPIDPPDRLHDVLRNDGAAVVHASSIEDLRRTILRTVAEPIDTGLVLAHARFREIRRIGPTAYEAVVELPEVGP